MKKSLKLAENHFLNMDSIIEWRYGENSITIITSLSTEDNGIRISTKETRHGIYWHDIVTSIQEVKRIIREISEYMDS